MAKKVELANGRHWSTQSAALGHFKDMLARYADNTEILDNSDHDDLLALLERYDESITDGPPKVGVGVDCFFRRKNVSENYATSSFWIRRIDGTETDFSYISAVKGQGKSRASEFYDACRQAVAADLRQAKQDHFSKHGDPLGRVPCDVTGNLISIDEAHLDHADPTFRQIALTFRAARGWHRVIPDGVLTLPEDAQTHTEFVDVSVAEAFREFHHRSALLRVVARGENLAKAASQRTPKINHPVKLP